MSRFKHNLLYFLAGSITAFLIFLLGAASFWAYGQYFLSVQPKDDSLALYQEAWQVIREDFIGEIPPARQRVYGAIRGSMETLNDPYTYFIEPQPASREQEQLQGHFGGIGAFLALTEDGRVRLQPMVDRPAEQAGVLDGDILIAIDGKLLQPPVDLNAVAEQLRGPEGSIVKLTVLRGQERHELAVTRRQIELPSVSWHPIKQAAGMGYIHIERFSALTDKELQRALQDLARSGASERLVLDLRGDPGGLLDAAIAVTGHFLDGGPVLIERQAGGGQKTYNAPRTHNALLSQPLAVLVDGQTASAAEIVAGALQDRGRGPLIGQKTFGKGSIQIIQRLSDGSAVHVTHARWLTPNEHQIDGQGLQPDIVVTAEGGQQPDPVLEAAIDWLAAAPKTSLLLSPHDSP